MRSMSEFFHSGNSINAGSGGGSFNQHKLGTNETGSGNDSDVYEFYFFYPDFTQIRPVQIILAILFTVEVVLCIGGNFLVCLIIWRNKIMHSPVNYYIVNLGICDFLIGIFVLPLKMFQLMAESDVNVMGDNMCTITGYLETTVRFASVFTLVAICVERYFAIVEPLRARIYLMKERIRPILLIVWLVPALIAAPNVVPARATPGFYFSDHGEFSRVDCFDNFGDHFRFGYYLFVFICLYIIPLIFIFGTCISIARVLMKNIPAASRRDPRAVSIEQRRRKVAKMVLIVIATFFLCWSPYFIVSLITQFQGDESFTKTQNFFFVMVVVNILAFSNSCVNPLVYFAMSSRFRRGFWGILHEARGCSRLRNVDEETSSRERSMTTGGNGEICRTLEDQFLAMNSHAVIPSSGLRANRSNPKGRLGMMFVDREGGRKSRISTTTIPLLIIEDVEKAERNVCNGGWGGRRMLPAFKRFQPSIVRQLNDTSMF